MLEKINLKNIFSRRKPLDNYILTKKKRQYWTDHWFGGNHSLILQLQQLNRPDLLEFTKPEAFNHLNQLYSFPQFPKQNLLNNTVKLLLAQWHIAHISHCNTGTRGMSCLGPQSTKTSHLFWAAWMILFLQPCGCCHDSCFYLSFPLK